MLRVLDLFSGVGGFALGLDRAGRFKTVGFCEIDPFCRKVLAKHYPGIYQHDDITTLTSEGIEHNCGRIDGITAGFPCQDISLAGTGKGLGGARSGLYSHVTRLAGEIRPRFILLENVAALLIRGLGTILGTLAEIGYDAEWHCIPAAVFGAPHIRDRIFILAYPASHGREGPICRDIGNITETMWGTQKQTSTLDSRLRIFEEYEQRFCEPAVFRMDDGLSSRMDRIDRLRACGNSVCPQVVEWIGRQIINAMA